jgi:ABC-2 type transport system permease protein
MNIFNDIKRETRFASSSRTTRSAWFALAIICALAIVLGRAEIARQLDTIERTLAQDQVELMEALDSASDYGGAAYAAFSLTWDAPSDAALLAIGQRDVSPWMLRIRGLALEGQIHESDNFNPELSMAGRFDYAFVIAFLLPLFLIVLLHDVYAAEREAGRVPMLTATVATPRRIWLSRIIVLVCGAALACLAPLWLLGLLFGTDTVSLMQVSGVVLTNVLFWSVLVSLIAFGAWSASVSAAVLTGCWLVLALIIPLSGKLLIDRVVPGVDGAAISLLQRETVNGAWDLPKSATMEPFYASHPQWAHSEPVTTPFHWKWYYAFQQMGDEAAAPLSKAYRDSIVARDSLTGQVAWLSPPVAVMRSMQKIARTDTQSGLAYDQRIRDYHARIRHFFDPVLFEEIPYSRDNLVGFPRFDE